jgi:F-type H+-transporting ATPase subunit gamma
MPSLIDLRRRIRSVANIRQITRAMKMVAAARLRRSQERMFQFRPYSDKMMDMLQSLAARTRPEEHPLLARREEKKICLMILTGDKGLCGSFNNNIIKRASVFLEEHTDSELSLFTVGKRGENFFRKRSHPIRHRIIDIFSRLSYEHAAVISQQIIKDYTSKDVDAVYMVYNEFKNVLQQRIVVQKLLPIEALVPEKGERLTGYIYEPAEQEIFSRLLPKYVEVEIYRALVESAAAENGARMSAMDNATNNSNEMMENLTLVMNKIRQAAITKEIIEVVSGAGM